MSRQLLSWEGVSGSWITGWPSARPANPALQRLTRAFHCFQGQILFSARILFLFAGDVMLVSYIKVHVSLFLTPLALEAVITSPYRHVILFWLRILILFAGDGVLVPYIRVHVTSFHAPSLPQLTSFWPWALLLFADVMLVSYIKIHVTSRLAPLPVGTVIASAYCHLILFPVDTPFFQP